jgi:hypothetical protein
MPGVRELCCPDVQRTGRRRKETPWEKEKDGRITPDRGFRGRQPIYLNKTSAGSFSRIARMARRMRASCTALFACAEAFLRAKDGDPYKEANVPG